MWSYVGVYIMPFKNILDVCNDAHGLLLRYDWDGILRNLGMYASTNAYQACSLSF